MKDFIAVDGIDNPAGGGAWLSLKPNSPTIAWPG
jgi:hypothetical protein